MHRENMEIILFLSTTMFLCFSTVVSTLPESNLNPQQRAQVITYHNYPRSCVESRNEESCKYINTSGLEITQPFGLGSYEMVWDDELASLAQQWANTCNFGHDRPPHSVFGTHYGQNLGQSYTDLPQVIIDWFDEHKNYNFCPIDRNGFHEYGHYTQVVWATSYKLGCGYAQCGSVMQMICNYGPGGNVLGQLPYIRSDVRPTPNDLERACISQGLRVSIYPGLCVAPGTEGASAPYPGTRVEQPNYGSSSFGNQQSQAGGPGINRSQAWTTGANGTGSNSSTRSYGVRTVIGSFSQNGDPPVQYSVSSSTGEPPSADWFNNNFPFPPPVVNKSGYAPQQPVGGQGVPGTAPYAHISEVNPSEDQRAPFIPPQGRAAITYPGAASSYQGSMPGAQVPQRQTFPTQVPTQDGNPNINQRQMVPYNPPQARPADAYPGPSRSYQGSMPWAQDPQRQMFPPQGPTQGVNGYIRGTISVSRNGQPAVTQSYTAPFVPTSTGGWPSQPPFTQPGRSYDNRTTIPLSSPFGQFQSAMPGLMQHVFNMGPQIRAY